MEFERKRYGVNGMKYNVSKGNLAHLDVLSCINVEVTPQLKD